MKWGTAAVLLVLVGCGDDSGSRDGAGGPGDGGDASATVGDGGGADLLGVDLTCTYGVFPGFPGLSNSERRFDCGCGCTVDPFTTTVVSGLWSGTIQGASFHPTAGGLEVTVDTSQASPAIGGLSSTLASNQFYLDGDFDLLVDYQLETPLPPAAKVLLQVDNLKNPADSVYTIERSTSVAGGNAYRAELAGIQPVEVATTAQSGTLELKRSGFTLQAIADGNVVTQYVSAVPDRMAMLVTAGLAGCSMDGGAPVDGSFAGCRFTVRWRNLRLVSGSLVDRRN